MIIPNRDFRGSFAVEHQALLLAVEPSDRHGPGDLVPRQCDGIPVVRRRDQGDDTRLLRRLDRNPTPTRSSSCGTSNLDHRHLPRELTGRTCDDRRGGSSRSLFGDPVTPRRQPHPTPLHRTGWTPIRGQARTSSQPWREPRRPHGPRSRLGLRRAPGSDRAGPDRGR